MRTMKKHTYRWLSILGYAGILAILTACAPGAQGADPAGNNREQDQSAVRIEDNVVQAQAPDGHWIPLTGGSAFDVTSELESTDPWQVAGFAIQTDEATRIDTGLQTGDLVRVQGVALEDGSWNADSIERAAQDVDPIIVLVGTVETVDPWTVNGIDLNVTPDTEVQGEITPGMFVRVEILLIADGTWEVLSIAPLVTVDGDPACTAVTATVASVDADTVQLEGWPALPLGGDVRIETPGGGRVAISPNQFVLVVVCPGADAQVVIVKIIVLNAVADGGTPAPGDSGSGKVLICHKPDKKGGHTLSVSSSAVPAHMGHGDRMGPCP